MAELFGKAAGLLRRQGRLDAPLRRRARLSRRPRHRGRPHSARDRHGVRGQVPGHRPGGGLLLRRGGGQQRRLPRDAQHGRAVEAARRSTSARTTATAWAPRWSAPARSTTSPSGPAPTTWPTRWWTGRTCWSMHAAMERAVAARPDRQAPHAARGPHLPLRGSLDVRPDPRPLPHQGGGRGSAEARPDRGAGPSGSSPTG